MKASYKIYILQQNLSKSVKELDLESSRMYPPQRQIREESIKIATCILEFLYNNGKAITYSDPVVKDVCIKKTVIRHNIR